ncbi:hypothetical protein PR003_g34665 [Phytophthora rubi]|uniref:Uncharacterized protein n=1 Tax=Phytophthora rubi TaxID=129364 RepID=A0A6A4AS12_9STRA|nr:hypothetical protein PR003_g34665 [Phytophthora rubi]
MQLPMPEVLFKNLSSSVPVPVEVGAHGLVDIHLASIFTP